MPAPVSLPAQPAPLRVSVILASTGRAEELGDVVRRLLDQSLKPHAILLSVHDRQDLPADVPAGVECMFGPKGLCAQRNRGLEKVIGSSDVVAFFDDDYLPSRTSIQGISDLFATHPDVTGATGLVLKDGVTIGGISAAEAASIVDSYDREPPGPFRIIADIRKAYGCNMCFRTSAIGDNRFDEALPLYGWQEDVDFAARLADRGRVVETDAFAGVHRGVSRARSPGLRLGYSQIVNPIYLVKKGTMQYRHAGMLMLRNVLANHVRSFFPESWIDRRGRAKGNRRALLDVVRGKIEPRRILEIDN